MFFFLKPSKLVVDAFIKETFIAESKNTPLYLSSPRNVQWWKSVPKGRFLFDEMTEFRSVKTCMGIINHLSTGIVLPLWSDLAFKFDREGWKFQFCDQRSKIEMHDNNQIPNFYNDHAFFKIISPWVLSNKNNVKFLYTDAFYHRQKALPINIIPGIVTPINKRIGTNVFFIVNKNASFEEVIKIGTPLFQIIPLTEKSIDLRIHVLTISEMAKIESFSGYFSFTGSGIKAKRHEWDK